MSEYIDKAEVIKECDRYAYHEFNIQHLEDVSEKVIHDADVIIFVCEYFKKFVEKLPSADTRANTPIKFIPEDRDPAGYTEFFRCSGCKGLIKLPYKTRLPLYLDYEFCPYCGGIAKR